MQREHSAWCVGSGCRESTVHGMQGVGAGRVQCMVCRKSTVHGEQGVGAGRVQCMVCREWVQGEYSAW